MNLDRVSFLRFINILIRKNNKISYFLSGKNLLEQSNSITETRSILISGSILHYSELYYRQ